MEDHGSNQKNLFWKLKDQLHNNDDYSISEISILGLTCNTIAEMTSNFPHIKKLSLLQSHLPHHTLMSQVVQLKNITTLQLELTIDMFSPLFQVEGRFNADDIEELHQSIASLSSLPNLHTLSLSLCNTLMEEGFNSEEPWMDTLLHSVAEITQLRYLHMRHVGICWGSYQPLANLFQSLPNLAEYFAIYYVNSKVLDAIREVGVRHDSLEKLGVYTSEVSEEDMSSLSTVCVEAFPSLALLEIHFVDKENCATADQMLDGLSFLSHHPKLRRLTLCLDYDTWGNDTETSIQIKAQERLGDKISITFRKHYDDYDSWPSVTNSYFEEFPEA